MQLLYILTAFPLTALAALNGRCTGSEATGEWGSKGICVRTSTCTGAGGAYKTGACPSDPADVKCCLVGRGPSISTNPCGAASWCDWTFNTCSGTRLTGKWCNCMLCVYSSPSIGYCPGGSNYKCCRI
ncbi:hypothetical protein QBC41DRAFT_227599 [Cercophora samala]|uniref:Uncharacterized protein n=1 Tax=Cercophora samala TaxID=330535 RepID=A0AA39ZBC4_9PEZI|nr:hypothetical protein QBC41DRAFT_227599 [Cercophora samala]